MKKSVVAIAGFFTGTALLMAAAPAMAHVDLGIHIGIPAAYPAPASVYAQPQPVYVAPQPVYAQPQPAYVETRPVYGASQVVYEDRGWHRDWRDQERREHEWRREHEREYGRYDRDDRRQEYWSREQNERGWRHD